MSEVHAHVLRYMPMSEVALGARLCEVHAYTSPRWTLPRCKPAIYTPARRARRTYIREKFEI